MNKEPINYIDWLELGRVIIPCLKGTPKVKKYTDPDFKIEKDIGNTDRDWETNVFSRTGRDQRDQ